MPRLKPKIKRPPIPKKMRAEAMQKNNGICMDPSGCTSKGVICEHVVPWRVVLEHKLENLEPRCKVHADAKTSSEHDMLSKVRRLARKASGKPSQITGRGFDRTKTRGFDGIVRGRMK